MRGLVADKQAGCHAVYPGLHPILGPDWPPKRSSSAAEAGAETGSDAGAGAAAAAVVAAAGAEAAGAAAGASSASADSPSSRRASEASSVAAGVAMRINPVIQTPRPSHNPQKERNRGKEEMGGRQQCQRDWKMKETDSAGRIWVLKVKIVWHNNENFR